MSPRVVIRADASVTIGTGHVMRCLTLAEALRETGAACHFVTRDLEGHLVDRIAARGFGVTVLPAPVAAAMSAPPAHASWAGVSWQQDARETRAAMDALGVAAWLVLDHYAFDERWERAALTDATRLLILDDLADRPHVADVLLDQNLGRAERDYYGLLPEDCELIVGPNHALLRPEFSERRASSLAARADRPSRHLMVSMGGTDPIDATSRVLLALRGGALPGDLRLTVVMGRSAPALESVRQICTGMPWPTELKVDVTDMAGLMAEADLGIGAGGITTWERCCMGLPTIMIEVAENQASAVAAMEALGAALGAGQLADSVFAGRLIAAVESALAPPVNARLSQISAALCQGDGAERLAALICDPRWTRPAPSTPARQ